MPASCEKESFNWSQADAPKDSGWDRDATIAPTPKQSCSEWSHRATRQYESARRQMRVLRWYHRSRSENSALERLFRDEVERWKRETQHWSSVTRALAHPSYLRIVGLAKLSHGTELERLLLEELEAEPDLWFEALGAITGENPVRHEYDFDESVNAWLEWGRMKGIIGIENNWPRRA
jgi:hypothetical protein